MQFTEGSFYHIYNRGNDKRIIFFEERNYQFFIEKIKRYIEPHCEILAWCLMPNHFHLLIMATTSSLVIVRENPIPINALTEEFRMLLSSYTKAIQKQEGTVGNLFQQKTKFKCADQYPTEVFHYIHQNPLRAGLCNTLDDYRWSSFCEYSGRQIDIWLCNQELTYRYLSINKDRFELDSYSVIPDDVIKSII